MNPRFLMEQLTKALKTIQAQIDDLAGRVAALEAEPESAEPAKRKPGRPRKEVAEQ